MPPRKTPAARKGKATRKAAPAPDEVITHLGGGAIQSQFRIEGYQGLPAAAEAELAPPVPRTTRSRSAHNVQQPPAPAPVRNVRQLPTHAPPPPRAPVLLPDAQPA
ncbi:hypothetical protein K525DRAFT_213054, partial [Schizophyllum commune Loenen D]